jgi:hypothetical protein
MRKSAWILLAAVVCLTAATVAMLLVQGVPAGKVDLNLVTAATSIRVFDPLLVRITLQNNTGRALVRDWPMDPAYGSAVEVRGRDGKFRPVRREHLTDVDFVRPVVPAGGRLVSYEILHQTRDALVFPEPGKYVIRARVDWNKVDYVSDPVAVQVMPIPKQEMELMEKLGVSETASGRQRNFVNELARDTWVYDSVFLDKERDAAVTVAELEQQLSDCQLKRTLAWKLAVRKVALAATREEGAGAVTALEELRKTFDPITNEIIDLALAQRYLQKQDLAALSEQFERIREPSNPRQQLEQQLRYLQAHSTGRD